MPYDDLPNDGWGKPDKGLPSIALTTVMIAVGATVLGGLLIVAVAGVDALVRAATPAQPTPAPTVTITSLVTVTASPAPQPTVTVTVTRTATPVSRSSQRPPVGSDEAFLRCVVHRESRGNPRAENPTSSASGLFQFLDGTWRAYARESGVGARYARASSAPPSVQWALARWVVEHKGRYPWKPTVPGTGC
jgi:hypothetical protein